MKPLYQHDCTMCIYLKSAEVCQKVYDFYYCGGSDNHLSATVIARFGNDGPDYFSGVSFSTINPMLALATTVAMARNLLSYEAFKAHTQEGNCL